VSTLLAVAVMLWILSSGCSLEAARGAVTRVAPPAAAAACMGADVATTAIGREVYGLREANPLLQHYAALAGAKLGLFALLYGTDRWVTPVPAWWWWGVAAGNCGVAGWNAAQIIREAR
jgi:hypothetical protein